MGDDLDELLDEVERRFCGRVSVSAAGAGGSYDGQKTEKHRQEEIKEETGGSSFKSKLPESSSSDDLDAFLDKLLEEDDCRDLSLTKTEALSEGPGVVKSLCGQSGDRKCCPVFIGGSSVQNGIGTSTSKRSCDQLRCTSCDFSVLTFEDCEWDGNCDYLFFRNHVPERSKLQSKLRRRRSFRSYCCQCSWISVSDVTELRPTVTPLLRWVCAGKH